MELASFWGSVYAAGVLIPSWFIFLLSFVLCLCLWLVHGVQKYRHQSERLERENLYFERCLCILADRLQVDPPKKATRETYLWDLMNSIVRKVDQLKPYIGER